jgi:hypothetical protein
MCLAGCGSGGVQPLTADDFHPHHAALAAEPPAGQAAGGSVAESPSQSRTVAVDPLKKPQPRQPASLVESIQNELNPTTQPSAIPTTMPTANNSLTSRLNLAGPATVPAYDPGQYMTLGAVLANVNGTPIYANKVIRKDANELRAYAREYDQDHFRDAASALIAKDVDNLIRDELEIAAAQRSLGQSDLQLAQILTSKWCSVQYYEAGGSEELARARARAEGVDFDEMKEYQHRRYLQLIYYQKKIVPQIEIGAQDELRYYVAHIADFTTPTKAVILLIEASPANLNGDKAAAIARLNEIKQRARGGEDFAAYARNQNDLPGAAGPDGDGGSHEIEPNSFILTNVEKQVWKVPIGQISDVIADQDAYYIFKVVSRDEGGTRSFADAAVQDLIYKKLSDQQLIIRRDAALDRLKNEAVVYPNPPFLEPAIEIALQNYSTWTQK